MDKEKSVESCIMKDYKRLALIVFKSICADGHHFFLRQNSKMDESIFTELVFPKILQRSVSLVLD